MRLFSNLPLSLKALPPFPLREVKLTGRLRGASAPLLISPPLSLRRRGGLGGEVEKSFWKEV